MKQLNLTKDQLIELIPKVKTKKELANLLNISTDSVLKYLRLYDIDFDTTHWKKGTEMTQLRQNPEINKQWLIDNWVNSTKSIKELAFENNISDSLLESRISFYKLTKKYKHTFNKDLFFDITDPHIWYLAGLAVTDGYFPKNFNGLTVSLVGDSEKDLLQEINNYYQNSRPITTYYKKQGTIVHNLQFSYDNIKQFFTTNFNMSIIDKTFTAETPTSFPNEDCAKAYIRGCLDGDGHIALKTEVVTLCTASESFVKGIGEIIKKYTNIDYKFYLTKRHKDKLYPMVSWYTNTAKKVLAWVYSLKNCFKLERKYQRYLDSITV